MVTITKITEYPKYVRIKPHFPVLFFVFGFLFDIATLGRIDDKFNILSHGAYLSLILFILRNQILKISPREGSSRIVQLYFEYQNEVLHFAFGSLLNAFFLFYFKSGSFAHSFLLFLFLCGLLIANELPVFQRRGPRVKVALTIVNLISFFLYLVPVLLGRIGLWIFVTSLFCAGFVVLAIAYYLSRTTLGREGVVRVLLAPAASVFLVFVMLYAFKLIPPVPLSLKFIGVYHNVQKSGKDYILTRETPKWKFWRNGDQYFVARPGDRVFIFTRIFSPGGFKGRIFVQFEQKVKGGWKRSDRIPLSFFGGKDSGFPSFAYKRTYQAGDWRALIETEDGLEVGRIGFEISLSNSMKERQFIQETSS